MKGIFKNFLVFFFIFLVIATLFTALSDKAVSNENIGINDFISLVKDEQISDITVSGNKINLVLLSGDKKFAKKEVGESFSSLVNNYSIDPDKLSKINIKIEENDGFGAFMLSLLPFLIPFILIVVFLYFMTRSVSGANSKAMMFGQSQAREFDSKQKNKVSFKDVAGAKEAKQELSEIVDFLRFPKKFLDLGARIPKGVLLLGSPGTGKTLIAKAVAGEAQVPFFSISGSEFVEMFVGVGASRVRSLFQRAKKNSPCIVFIDEIDAVGRRRGAGLGGSHDEREQTLNQILVEMDGFDPSTNIIVIAATNRPDVLDPALLRPGRFDRQVVLDLPDLKDREEILAVHARKKPIAKDVDLKSIAERTPGFSGADLANVLNEAAILAARENKKIIELPELFEAIEKVLMGPERKSRVITDEEKKITAYHEAGHALVAHFSPNTDPVHKISIIARGQAGGYTLKLPSFDKRMYSKNYFLDEIAVLLAGHLAEKKIFGEVTTGATSDLRRATNIARKLITDYGMSEKLGPRTFGEKEDMIFLGREIHEQRDYSEKVAELIDEEISRFISEGELRAQRILDEKSDKLEAIVKVLLEKETIEKEEFEEIMAG
ncbi:MAG: ATP-dependent zinc metalloprotease FtsH [Patescibacteria group bacterium]|jgi:cell division protease FtsH|nr:ATP-dependent zinc metalloprotease FtsH [Patescibacteria group bacterium]